MADNCTCDYNSRANEAVYIGVPIAVATILVHLVMASVFIGVFYYIRRHGSSRKSDHEGTDNEDCVGLAVPGSTVNLVDETTPKGTQAATLKAVHNKLYNPAQLNQEDSDDGESIDNEALTQTEQTVVSQSVLNATSETLVSAKV